MNSIKKIDYISNWIKKYATSLSFQPVSLVIGVSGGIDSAVTSALSAKTGFKPKSKIMLRNQMKILDINKNEVGYISSGGFSPILNSSIAIGYLDQSKLTNNKIYCLIRDKLEELEIEKLPFISNNYKRG